MQCPHCHSDNSDGTESCVSCGLSLSAAIDRGSVIAGRYEVLLLLGRGGMGTVYKAHDRVLDETVALKTLRADVAQDLALGRRFRSEIKLARKVRHRNVCGIHEYGEDGPLRYIAMEYVEGTDLKQDIVRRGGLPAEEAFGVAIQAADGLQAIHDVGIIHRDLKPSNIMRDQRGLVRLMDFGIAKEYGASTGATAIGQIVGTPEYMSPEQARGQKLDFRSDLYALGIVIFEMFTGYAPFHGDTPISTILKQIQQPPPLDDPERIGIPTPLAGVLRRLLAKEPAERHATAHDVVRALDQARRASHPGQAVSPITTATVPVPEWSPAPVALPPTPVPAATPIPAAPATPLPQLEASLRELERRVAEAVGRGELTAAEMEVALARKRYGTAPAVAESLRALEQRIEEVRRRGQEERQRAERLAAFVERGRALRAENDLEGARLALQAALEIDAGHPEASALLESVEQAAARQREDERRRQAALAAAERVEQLLAQGQLEQACEVLTAAQREHGAPEPLAALARRLAELERQSKETAAEGLLARAESLARQDKLEEAQAALREASRVDPSRDTVRRRLAQVTKEIERRLALAQRALAVAEAVKAAEVLAAAGEYKGARKHLGRVEKELGSSEAFRAARQLLDEQERRVKIETQQQRASASAQVTARQAAVPSRSLRLGLAVALAASASLVWVLGRSGPAVPPPPRAPTTLPSPLNTPAPAAPQPSLPATSPSPEGGSRFAASAGVMPAGATRSSSTGAKREPAPAASSPPPTMAVGPPSLTSTPAPLRPAAEAPTPTASDRAAEPVASGSLQLVVHPWAEVSVDGNVVGTTPFRPLSLAAGVHTITLTHPDYKPFQRKVTIRPAELTRLEVDLSWEAFRR